MKTLQVQSAGLNGVGVFCRGDEPRLGQKVRSKETAQPREWTVTNLRLRELGGFDLELSGPPLPAPRDELTFI